MVQLVMEAKIRRHQQLLETRQAMVLQAARSVLASVGLERASMREIAKAAGYTPGALYAHFKNKQALLVALLEEALERLQQAVLSARPARTLPDQTFLLQGDAWMAFLLNQPRELELLLYFLGGRGQTDLAADLASHLHERIRLTLDALAQALLAQGQDAAQVDTEIEALLAQGIGLLVAQNASHNAMHVPLAPRTPQALFESYLRRLWASTTKASETEGPLAQVDLFG